MFPHLVEAFSNSICLGSVFLLCSKLTMDDTDFENELAVYREKLKQRESTWLNFFAKCESSSIEDDLEISIDNLVEEYGLIKPTHTKRQGVKRGIKSTEDKENLVGSSKKLERPPSKKKALRSNKETSTTGLCKSTTISLRKKPLSSTVTSFRQLNEFLETLHNENSDPEMKDNNEIKNGNASSNISNFSEENAVSLDANFLNTKYIIEETLNSNIGSMMVKRLQCKFSNVKSNSVDPENTYAFWHNAVKAELIRLMKIIPLEKLEKYLHWYVNEWDK